MASTAAPTGGSRGGVRHATGKMLLQQHFSPRIAAITTPDVPILLQRMQCASMSDLLAPFASVEKAVVRDMSSGAQQSLPDFRVRFVEINKIEDSLMGSATQLLGNAVHAAASQDVPKRVQISDGQVKVISSGKQGVFSLEELTPWYAEYRRWFLKLFAASEHETFDHPVACVFFVTSDNTDPLAALSKLNNVATAVPVFEKGWIDPAVLKYYVLVHDERSSNTQNVDELFQRMKKSFGLHCHLLRVNAAGLMPPSGTPSSASTPHSTDIPDYWQPFADERAKIALYTGQSPAVAQQDTFTVSQASAAAPGEGILSLLDLPIETEAPQVPAPSATSVTAGPHAVLAQSDVTAIRNMMRELIVQSLVPYMERNMQHWNEQVAVSRRGLTGRFFQASKKYFGTTGGRGVSPSPAPQQPLTSPSGSPTGAQGIVYPYGAPEAQLRKLADFAFMLRDYKFAAAIYDTVRKDFFNDKAWKYYAGAMEMHGLCQLCIDTPVNVSNIEQTFDQAISHYHTRCRLPQYATRATLLYYELLRSRIMHRSATSFLIRMTTEDSDLRSALLLEQAALCFLEGSSVAPMARKYMFHLVLAGHRFGKAGQREHSMRCYLTALELYEEKAWKLIQDHLLFTLTRQSFHAGRLQDAVDSSVKLLRPGGQQSASQQSNYLKEFLYIYTSFMDTGGAVPSRPLGLLVPDFPEAQAHIILANDHSTSEQAGFAGDQAHSVWREMEEHLEACMFSAAGDGSLFLSRGSTVKRLADLGEMVVGAVGEEAYLSVQVYNPLHIELSINELRALCEFKPSGRPGSPLFTPDSMEEFVDVQSIPELVLQPLTAETVHIKLTPKVEGRVVVTGLRYFLHGTVPCQRQFMKRGKRLNDTKEQRHGIAYAPDHTLTLVVNSPMPLLDVALHGLPDVLLAGEIVKCSLEVTNKGAKAMTNLRVNVSQPTWAVMGTHADLERSAFAEASHAQQLLTVSGGIQNLSVVTIELPHQHSATGGSLLDADATTLIPVWVRCDKPGKQVIRFLFAYQAADEGASSRNCRVHRFVTNLNVLSSVNVSTAVQASADDLDEATLSLEMENTQSALNVAVTQLVVASPAWAIDVNKTALSGTRDILPRQVLSEQLLIRRLPAQQTYAPERYTANSLRRMLLADSTSERPPDVQLTFSTASLSHNYDAASEPLQSLLIRAQTQHRRDFLANAFPGVAKAKRAQCFTLLSTHDVLIAVYWTVTITAFAADGTAMPMLRHGVSYVFGTNLAPMPNPIPPRFLSTGPSKALFTSTLKEKAALVLSLTKNRHLRDSGPVRAVFVHAPTVALAAPVTTGVIRLLNNSWLSPVHVDIELALGAIGSAPPPWTFLGLTKHTVELAPGERADVPVSLVFNRPGVFDIGLWSIRGRLLSAVQTQTTAQTSHDSDAADSESVAFAVQRQPMLVQVY
ncbi:hypothetical protein RI367_000880 [Sorochytrium milnesiophthora]